jgi:hypothetical protein
MVSNNAAVTRSAVLRWTGSCIANPFCSLAIRCLRKAGAGISFSPTLHLLPRDVTLTDEGQMKQEEIAKDSSGPLFRPMKSGKDVYGGWTEASKTAGKWEGETLESSDGESRSTKHPLGMAAGIAVPVGMGLAYWLRRRQQKKDRWEQAA